LPLTQAVLRLFAKGEKMIDHVLLKVKIMGDVDEDTLKEIIDGIYNLHLDVYSVESEAVEQGAQADEEK